MHATRWPLIGLFIYASIFFLNWASGFLIPMTAALLGYLASMPLERRLSRLGVPSIITAIFVVIGLACIIIFVMFSLVTPLTELINDLPAMLNRLRYDLANSAGGVFDRLQDAADATVEALSDDDGTALEVRVKEDQGIVFRIASIAPSLAGQLIFTLVMLLFLIASGRSFVRKFVSVLPSLEDKRVAVRVVNEVVDRLAVYLAGISLINAGLGLSIGLLAWALGIPNPLLFALIGFSFNFIPYLGAIAGACLMALTSYSAFGDFWAAFLALGGYMALSGIEGQFVTPYVISGRLKLNPTIVFAAVAFFAWIWSVIGMVVAVPILASAKIILDHFPSTRKIGLFLGAEDESLVET